MLIWKAHSRLVDALAFGPDGRTLAVAGYHLACRLLDAGTGERLWTVGSSSAFGLSLAFVPRAANRLLCRQSGLSVRDAGTGAEVRRFPEWCQSFAPAPTWQGAFVAESGPDRVRDLDLNSADVYGEVELDAGAINRMAVTPDGQLLAVVGCKRFVLLRTEPFGIVAEAAHRALSSGAFALAVRPDGRAMAYSAGRTLFVLELPSARPLAQFQLPARHFMDAAFTPDGRSLLAVSKEGAVHMYDGATWALTKSFDWGVGPLRAVAVSPDGTRAAAAGDSGRVVVWDLD